MANRPSGDQSIHDSVVEARADELDKQYSTVKADGVSGYGTPNQINGHVPDIHAKDGANEKVVEVETTKSDDSGQRQSFKSWASSGVFNSYEGLLATARQSWTQFESR